MKTARLALITLTYFLCNAANAGIITFDNRAAFIAATGATAIGPIPMSASTGDFSLGGLNFITEPPASFNRSRNWSTVISEAFDLAINGREQFNIESAGPIFSIGFDFHEPILSTPPGPTDPDTCNTVAASCIPSEFEVTLLNGAAIVDSFQFQSPTPHNNNLLLQFVGVGSSDPFDRIEIRELVGTADNEFFGNFLIGRTPVPEPATLLLLGLALAGLGIVKGRAR